jgi:hypothetical protein
VTTRENAAGKEYILGISVPEASFSQGQQIIGTVIRVAIGQNNQHGFYERTSDFREYNIWKIRRLRDGGEV